jgi:dolichol-phosphate mannosyltransferase
MDCDLQDQPEEIPKLYVKALEGYDVVVGRRVKRKDALIKRMSSKIFLKIFDYLTEQKTNPEVANFGIYSKLAIANVKLFREEFRNFGLMVNWLGFNRFELEIKHAERPHGKTAYNFAKRIRLGSDSIISHSDKPLRLFFNTGLAISFFSILFAIFLLCRYFFMKMPFPGWTSIIVSLFFLSGILLASIGFVGLYIGKIFKQVKERPLYIVQQKINYND